MAFNNENNNDCCKCTTPEYELILNEQGPQGRQGEKGEPGFTPIISVKDNTDSNYTLNILTQDGQITTPNLKANLPAGGATGQVLTKNSANQDDCSWQNLPNATTEVEGIARLATEEDFETTEDTEASNNSIVTPALFNSEFEKQSANFVTINTNQIIEANKTLYGLLYLPFNSSKQNGRILTNARFNGVDIPIIEPYDINGSFRIGAAEAKDGLYTDAQNGFDINNDIGSGTQGVTYYEQGQKGKIIASFNIDKYIKAGDNITIDKTSTGITINSTGGGEIPSNMVTTDTSQTINGQKEFKETILSLDNNLIRGQQSEAYRNGAGLSMGSNSVSTDGGAFAPQWNIYNTTGGVDRTETIITTYNQSTLNNSNFNVANKLVRLDASGKLPAIDGSQLTNLNLPTGNFVTLDAANTLTGTYNFTLASTVMFNTTPIFNYGASFSNQEVVIPKLKSTNSITATNITMENAGNIITFPRYDTGSVSITGPKNSEYALSGLYISGKDIAEPAKLLTALDVDGTTINYDPETGKISAIGGASNPSDAYSVTTLNNNQDLNLLTTEGLYFVDSGSNFPSGVSSTRGFVRVEKLNYPDWSAINGSLVQTFTTINSFSTSAPPDIYARFRTTTSFSPWTKVNTTLPTNMVTTENFSSVAPTGNLKYWTGTETDYTGLESKDSDTLYRTTDTNKVYLGTIQIGG